MTEEKKFIETVDEKGNNVTFELFDVVEFEGKEYALLLPPDAKEEESEIVLMRLITEGEDYIFESIDDDEEFEKVSDYIENFEDEE